MLVILLVLSVSLGVGLAACGPTPVTITDGTNTATITPLETPTPTKTPPVAVTVSTPTATATYTLTPTDTPTPCPSATPGTIDEELRLYGAKFSDNWSSPTFKSYILSAVKKVAIRLSEQSILPDSPQAAFKKVFDGLEFVWGCSSCSAWALSYGTKIEFVNLYPNENRSIRFIIHEIGHVFDQRVCMAKTGLSTCDGDPVRNGYLRARLTTHMNDLNKNTHLKRNDYGDETNSYHGFAGGKEIWQFAVQAIDKPVEIWADMFLGWTFQNLGSYRQNYMNEEIPHYLQIIAGNP
jgi:hypothetical protein